MTHKNPFTQATPIEHVKVGVFGPQKCGKTTFLLTAPRPLALADTEGGADAYVGTLDHLGNMIEGFDSMKVGSLEDLKEAIAFMKADRGQTYRSFGIDSISVIVDRLKADAMRISKKAFLRYQDRAWINDQMRSIYADLALLPAHVIVVAREAIEYETGNNQTLIAKGTKPDTDKWFPHLVDYLIQMDEQHVGHVRLVRGTIIGVGKAFRPLNFSIFQTALKGGLVDPDDMSVHSHAEQFYNHWLEQGLSKSDILAALEVERLLEWTAGIKAADAAVTAYIEANASDSEGGLFSKFRK